MTLALDELPKVSDAMPRSLSLRTYTPSDKHYAGDARAAVAEVRDGVNFFAIEQRVYSDMHTALIALGYELTDAAIPCKRPVKFGGKPLSMTKTFTYRLSGVKTLEQELEELEAQMQTGIFDGFERLLDLLIGANPDTRSMTAKTLTTLLQRGCLNADRFAALRSATAQWGGRDWRAAYNTAELRAVIAGYEIPDLTPEPEVQQKPVMGCVPASSVQIDMSIRYTKTRATAGIYKVLSVESVMACWIQICVEVVSGNGNKFTHALMVRPDEQIEVVGS